MFPPPFCTYLPIDDPAVFDPPVPFPADQTGAVPVMTLTRLAETVTSTSGGRTYTGRRSTLEIKGHTFHGLERLDRRVHLPKGEFKCSLGHRGSNGKECVHIAHDVTRKSDGKKAGIVMHVANYPHHLEGCIAIGMTRLSSGIGQSGKAFDKLFELIAGKFEKGAKAVLKVEGVDMYGGGS